jgi:ribosomal protein S18 acetylase RimI-like enzyme
VRAGFFTRDFKQATADDADAVVELEHRIADARLYSAPLDRPSALQQILSNTYHLIMLGSEVVGTVAYRTVTDQLIYVSNLAVDPAYRERGIARAAMTFVLGRIDERARVQLVTHPDNAKALRLYKSLGFVCGERVENYFGDGEPRLELLR